MKILHLNTHDILGGAARAAGRIHLALLASGVDSRMLVQIKSGDDPAVSGPDSRLARGLGYARPYLDKLGVYGPLKNEKAYFHPARVPFFNLHRKIAKVDPDIVNLHWVAGGFFRIEDLRRIRKPIVWTMHDMWPFTGGCHYDEGCHKFHTGCESCPLLRSIKKNDLSARVFKRKQEVYGRLENMTMVGISRWLCRAARQSPLLEKKRVVNIPNPIDTDAFRPLEKQTARDMLGLPRKARVVLMGAKDVMNNTRKGLLQLDQALGRVASENVVLAVFGADQPKHNPVSDFQTYYLGSFRDDLSIRVVYSAADVTVLPSSQENFSNIILESLACGTPVVAFRIGGNPDMIEHKQNGYMAEPFDFSDIARGLDWILEHPAPEELSLNAREKVLANFGYPQVAAQYMAIYEDADKQSKS